VGRRWATGRDTALNGRIQSGFLLTLASEVGAAAPDRRSAVEEAGLRARRDHRQSDADTVRSENSNVEPEEGGPEEGHQE